MAYRYVSSQPTSGLGVTELSIAITAASLVFGVLKKLLFKVVGDAEAKQRKSVNQIKGTQMTTMA